jgi:hypothetical protein
MAAETVANVLTDARIACVDLADDADTLRWLNVVHRNLVEEFRLVTTSIDLTLTTTSREYSLGDQYTSIWSAEYRSSATATPIPVSPTSVDELDSDYGAWRDSRQSEPRFFYQYTDLNGAAVVGFDRLPSVATSGGYPTVRLYVSQYAALTAVGSIPASVRDYKVYVWGLCCEFAKMRKRDELPVWQQLYEDAKNQLGVYVMRRQRNNDPKIIPMLRAGVGAR